MNLGLTGSGREGELEFGEIMHTTAIFKMDKQQGPTVQHMELYSMLWASLDASGVAGGRMDTCVCVCVCVYIAEFLLHSPETTTTLLIGCTPKQNKKFKV